VSIGSRLFKYPRRAGYLDLNIPPDTPVFQQRLTAVGIGSPPCSQRENGGKKACSRRSQQKVWCPGPDSNRHAGLTGEEF
jgi:hypothetical protein